MSHSSRAEETIKSAYRLIHNYPDEEVVLALLMWNGGEMYVDEIVQTIPMNRDKVRYATKQLYQRDIITTYIEGEQTLIILTPEALDLLKAESEPWATSEFTETAVGNASSQ